MKTLFKSIAASLIVAALFNTTQVKAQTTQANDWRLGIGIDAADPTGVSRLGATFILGGNIRLQYGLSNNFALTLTGGADHYFPKTIPGTDTKYDSYGEIPITAGFKWFFVPGIYLGGEAGVVEEASDKQYGPARFGWAPALGYATTHWDFGVRYMGFSSFGMVAARVAYGFKL
jgi:hypothetical protein